MSTVVLAYISYIYFAVVRRFQSPLPKPVSQVLKRCLQYFKCLFVVLPREKSNRKTYIAKVYRLD